MMCNNTFMRKNKKSFLSKQEAVKKYNVLNIICAMMLISLLALFIFTTVTCIIGLIKSTDKTSYVFPLIQRVFAIALTFMPVILKRVFNVKFPVFIIISYYLYMFLSVYLGNFVELYEISSLYNKFVHGFSGIALCLIAMFFVRLYNKNRKKDVCLIFLFVFVFSVAIGACWEISDFVYDAIFDANRQMYKAGETMLIGREALFDTMFDMIANVAGAIIGACLCSLCCYKNKNFVDKFSVELIKRKNKNISKIEDIEEIEE